MIIRGTTPTISFNVHTELDLSEVAEVWITFKSKMGSVAQEITFTIEDVEIDAANKKIDLFMSQEETLEFSAVPYDVQIRLKTDDGLAYASSVIEQPIGRILKDGVI